MYFDVKIDGTFKLDAETVGAAQERVNEMISELGDMGSQVSIRLASICGRETDINGHHFTCTKKAGHKGGCWA